MLARLKRVIRNIRIKLVTQDGYIQILRNEGCKIGNGCWIDKRAQILEPRLVHIGNCCRITQGVKFITHDGSIWTLRNCGFQEKNADIGGVIEVGNNVHIGWDAIILPNVKIGDNCIIGAGAVVTKSIPNNSVAVGVPAKVIESVEEFNKKSSKRIKPLKEFNEKQRAELLWRHFEEQIQN